MNRLDPSAPYSGHEERRSYYPPPNQAFIVLVIAVTGTLVVGALTVNSTGKAGLFLIESLFLLPPLVYLQLKGYNIKRCLRWNGVSLPVILSSILIGISLIVLLDELDRMVAIIFPMPVEVQEALFDFMKLRTWSDYLFVGTGAVVAAAICEESLFRGFMQVSMEAFGSVTRAVLFGALLFALAHFNPWWLIQILILGVLLGFVSWRTNSVFPAMIIHGLNNGIALIFGGAIEGKELAWYTAGKHVSPAVIIAALALLFIAIKFLLRLTEESFPEPVPKDDPSQS